MKPKQSEKKKRLLENIFGNVRDSPFTLTVSEQSRIKMFSQTIPEIQLPNDIDVEELKTALGQRELVTFTLPIGMYNAESHNGVKYLPSSVDSLVKQVNEKRVEAMWGHYDYFEMGTRYDPPPARWLAAEMHGDIAYALCLAISEEAKRHVLSAKAAKAKIGTSILGWNAEIGEIDEENELVEIKGYDLITIDLASPERVGIPMTAADPMIVKHMSFPSSTSSKKIKENRRMDPINNGDAEDTQVTELEKAQNLIIEQRRQLQQLRMYESDIQSVRELLGIDTKTGDPLAAIRELQRKSEGLAAENARLLVTHIEESVKKIVKFTEAQPAVVELVKAKKPSTASEVETAISEAVESPAIKVLLETLRKINGGNNHTPATDPGDRYEDDEDEKSAVEKYLEARPELEDA